MKFIDPHHNEWHTVGGEDGPMAHPPIKSYSLLSLPQWHAVREQWPLPESPSYKPVGLMFPNDHDIESLEKDTAKLSLIALSFPKWVDGRAYSQAHILRARYGFKGELRATGEILVDMLPLLVRTGFDTAILRHDQDLAAAERALGFFVPVGYYQGAMDMPQPHFNRSRLSTETKL